MAIATNRCTQAITSLLVARVANPRIICTMISKTNPMERPWRGLNGGFNVCAITSVAIAKARTANPVMMCGKAAMKLNVNSPPSAICRNTRSEVTRNQS
jgi:hypothetical protein